MGLWVSLCLYTLYGTDLILTDVPHDEKENKHACTHTHTYTSACTPAHIKIGEKESKDNVS